MNSVPPFKKDQAFRSEWRGNVNGSQLRIKKIEDTLIIQKVSTNVFAKIYNKIIKNSIVQQVFGKKDKIKPILEYQISVNKNSHLQTHSKLQSQFLKALPNAIKNYNKQIEKKINSSLKNGDLKYLYPKLRQFREQSNGFLKDFESDNERNDFEVINEFVAFSQAFKKMMTASKKWSSDALLTSDEIINYAADYPVMSEETVKEFAGDATGTPSQNLYVQKFAAQTLGLNTLKISINPVTPGLVSGMSGEPVYMVCDKESKQLLCVIKIKDSTNITQEINGLRLMKKQNMSNCHFPKVMGIGKCVSNNEQLILFAQSPAKGASLDAYIKKVGSAESDDEKKIAKKILGEAMRFMAKGMAELHNQKINGKSAAEEILIKNPLDEFKDQMLNIVVTLSSEEHLFSPDYVNDIKQRIAEAPLSSSMPSLAHGDFHPGNVFYSKESHFLTLIDNDEILNSLDENLTLRGTASYDFAYCYEWIFILCTINNFNETERTQLLENFEMQYCDFRKDLDKKILKNELNFMKTFLIIKYLDALTKALKLRDHPWHISLGEQKLEGLRALLLTHFKATT
jgi:hypothetical protein